MIGEFPLDKGKLLYTERRRSRRIDEKVTSNTRILWFVQNRTYSGRRGFVSLLFYCHWSGNFHHSQSCSTEHRLRLCSPLGPLEGLRHGRWLPFGECPCALCVDENLFSFEAFCSPEV
jgi:hypothetical protein